jgi:hypothetical protein
MKKIFFIPAITFLLLTVLFFSSSHALVFYPVKYNFWSSPLSLTVNSQADMPIYVQNLGLLQDKYNVTVVLQGPNPNVISVDNSPGQTEQLSIFQIGQTTAKLTLQSASGGSITLRVYVMSNNDANCNPVSACTIQSECSYLEGKFDCFSGKCAKYTELVVRTGMASLPDFGWFGLLQIILIASILVLLKF